MPFFCKSQSMISIAVGLYNSIFKVNTWWFLGFSLSFMTSSVWKGIGHLFFTISPSLGLSKALSWFSWGYGFWGRINVKGPPHCVKQGYMNSVLVNSGDLNIDYWLKWYLLSFSTEKQHKTKQTSFLLPEDVFHKWDTIQLTSKGRELNFTFQKDGYQIISEHTN